MNFYLRTFEYSWSSTADSLTVEYRVGFVSEFYPNQELKSTPVTDMFEAWACELVLMGWMKMTVDEN